MTHPLVGVHAILGELGAMAFLWVFVEALEPTPGRLRRAKLVALAGTALLLTSWVVGGYYYVSHYGASVKPEIKAGPEPWAHAIFMETKEHVFLLLPFLAIAATLALAGLDLKEQRNRNAVLALAASTLALGLAMGAMGFLISSGYRAATGGA